MIGISIQKVIYNRGLFQFYFSSKLIIYNAFLEFIAIFTYKCKTESLYISLLINQQKMYDFFTLIVGALHYLEFPNLCVVNGWHYEDNIMHFTRLRTVPANISFLHSKSWNNLCGRTQTKKNESLFKKFKCIKWLHGGSSIETNYICYSTAQFFLPQLIHL